MSFLREPMGAPRSCVSSGECCHGTAGGPFCWFVPTATRRAVTSTAGSGTVFRDGRTESGASVGDAALVLDCATHPKASICAVHTCFGLSETYRARSHGFLTFSLHLKTRRNCWDRPK